MDAGEVLAYLCVFVSIYFAASCINKIVMQGKRTSRRRAGTSHTSDSSSTASGIDYPSLLPKNHIVKLVIPCF